MVEPVAPTNANTIPKSVTVRAISKDVIKNTP